MNNNKNLSYSNTDMVSIAKELSIVKTKYSNLEKLGNKGKCTLEELCKYEYLFPSINMVFERSETRRSIRILNGLIVFLSKRVEFVLKYYQYVYACAMKKR